VPAALFHKIAGRLQDWNYFSTTLM